MQFVKSARNDCINLDAHLGLKKGVSSGILPGEMLLSMLPGIMQNGFTYDEFIPDSILSSELGLPLAINSPDRCTPPLVFTLLKAEKLLYKL